MSLSNVQTTLWKRAIVENYQEKGVFVPLMNRDVKQIGANEWRIITATAASSSDVNDSADITYAALSDSLTSLATNFDKHVPMIDFDSDGLESSVEYLGAYIRESASTLTNDLDAGIGAVYGDAGTDSYETGTTSWQFTKDTCAEVPGFMASLTNDARTNNWPEDKAKFVVGPPGLEEAILTYTGGRATSMGDEVINGRKVMKFMGWNLMFTNQLTTASSVVHGIALVNQDAIALALQTNQASVESGRAEGRHGTWYRPRLKAAYKVYRAAGVIDINLNSTVVATS